MVEDRRYRARSRQRLTLRGSPTDADQDEAITTVLKADLATHAVPDPFRQGQTDLYAAVTGEFAILPPPAPLSVLLRMPNDNAILRQCIEAMVINVEGHGHRLEYVGPDGEEQSDEAVAEEQDIEALLDNINPDMSLIELRRRWRWDIETLGFAYGELGRTRDGLPSYLGHIPAHTMRCTVVDPEPVEVEVTTYRKGQPVKTKMMRRFRRFVQIVGTKKVWFKECGDPRVIDPETGQVNNALAWQDSATEVVFFKQYYPGQVYGLPRWYNNLVAIQGSRQAELTNLDYFKDNAIPAMAVLVSGGYLQDDTVGQLEEHLTAARGRSAQNRIVILEAYGDDQAASESGAIPLPKIEIKPLAGERPKEGMFLEYDKAQLDKVRSSFRLPPIFTGHAQDYSHASAKTSYEVAEGQVFGPERAYIDDTINRVILAPFGFRMWEVRSNPPQISDPEEVIKAVEAFDKVGAMTPNVAIGLANETFGLDIPLVEEEWGNYPFPIVSALADQGRLKGLDEIAEEVDNGLDATDPGNTDAADTGTDAKPAKGKGKGKPQDSKDGKDTANATKELQRRSRRALRDLRTVLDAASSAR